MSKKKRGKSRAAQSTSTPASSSATSSDSQALSDSTRKQRRSERINGQREARKASDQRKNQGIRPWILPGFVGIAVIAVVLVGITTLSDEAGESAGSDVPSPVLGQQAATVEIHEYGDFQCPFCGVFSRNIKPALKAKYFDTGIASLVWHDFAWHGRESLTAANAARCAGEQDMFWEFHDVLFVNQRGDNQGAFANDNLKFFGEQLGLEAESFNQCVDDDRYRDAIAADIAGSRRLRINGTPSFVIGDQRIVGGQPVEVFEQAIEAELARAAG